MSVPHPWQDCSPAVLTIADDVSEHERELATYATKRIWATLTSIERRRFHEFTCLNLYGPEQLAVVEKISQGIRRAVTSHLN